MTRKSAKSRSDQIYSSLETLTNPPRLPGDGEDEPLDLSAVQQQPIMQVADTSRTLRMKKFRAQLLHSWLVNTFKPCRAADIGGGKGLLSYLLIQSGWQAAVIDPFDQPLPEKYKDIISGARVKISPDEAVPRITTAYESNYAHEFDLLIGMHAHGCNALIINSATQYGCGFVLFPCCVIDEPFYPRLGVHWIETLADYAVFKGHKIFPFRLNFKGQNIGICSPGSLSFR